MRIVTWVLVVAATTAALPTESSQPQSHLRLPRQGKPASIDSNNPPIQIPDVAPGTELATDPLTGYKAWISNGLTRTIEGIAWLTETLAVIRGDRDEPRGGSPAAGNGS